MIYKGKNVIQWEEKKVSSTNDAQEPGYLYGGCGTQPIVHSWCTIQILWIFLLALSTLFSVSACFAAIDLYLRLSHDFPWTLIISSWTPKENYKCLQYLIPTCKNVAYSWWRIGDSRHEPGPFAEEWTLLWYNYTLQHLSRSGWVGDFIWSGTLVWFFPIKFFFPIIIHWHWITLRL